MIIGYFRGNPWFNNRVKRALSDFIYNGEVIDSFCCYDGEIETEMAEMLVANPAGIIGNGKRFIIFQIVLHCGGYVVSHKIN